MAFISLCMIVKDEEPFIGRCLESVRGIADELIVVDTGSTDRTKECSRALGAKVLDYPWEGDFAAARNFGIKQAAGEWILWLDADEQLSVTDSASFLQAVSGETGDLLALAMTHYYGAEPPEQARSYRSAGYRLFRNHRGIFFEGRVHERLNLNAIELPDSPRLLESAAILHDGYLDSVVAGKQKANRNLQLLLKERVVSNDPWTSYHIAGEYYREQKFQDAYDEVNAAIKGFLQRGALPPALAYKLKYEILLNSGDAGDSLPGIERALRLYPDYVDLHYYHGLMLLRLGRFSDAEDSFTRCLALGDSGARYLTLTGTGSFYAFYYLGRCREALGDPSGARRSYMRALALYPNFSEAAARLDAIPDRTQPSDPT